VKKIYIVTLGSLVLNVGLFSVSFDTQDQEVKKILNVLHYTKGHSPYDGADFQAGYQTHELDGVIIQGQRDCAKRLARVPYDFTDKTVLDIGCNQGGMLFALMDKIKYGVGVDYDSRLINAANCIKSFMQAINLDFFVFNLDKEPLPMINNFLKVQKVDICFLLAVCQWIKRWRMVIDYAATCSDVLLFESNGTEKLQKQEVCHLKKRYKTVILINNNSNDDKIECYKKVRKLYLCKK
jgi:SAM-dependent methyltransferase